MSNELFEQNPETPETVKVDPVKEAAKKRKADLKSGKIRLTEKDFKTVGGETWKSDWERYSTIISAKEKTSRDAWNDDAFVRDEVQGTLVNLHKHEDFKKYSGVKKAAAAATGIPEFDKFMELKKAAEEKFAEWIKTCENCKAVGEYLKTLGLPEEISLPEFTLYYSGKNPVSKWIKDQFKK
jgi:hypothetical protein